MNKTDPAYIDFDTIIDRVSKKWMADIIGFLEDLYKDKWLPSHDINHHMRVWHNAVELSRTIFSSGINLKPSFIDELIICCFFHDTGLLIDPGEFHGVESRLLADRFLTLSAQKVNFDKSALLDAIEKHDDKNYLTSNINSNLLLEILSLADDIDAFGAIGLYRYIEIYLLRGFDDEKIPGQVISNANKRYENLIVKLNQYMIDSSFYTNNYKLLINLLDDNSFADTPLSLVKLIKEKIVILKGNPDLIISRINISENVKDRIWFFANNYTNEIAEISRIKKK